MHRPPRAPRTSGSMTGPGPELARVRRHTTWVLPVGLALLAWAIPHSATAVPSATKPAVTPVERQAMTLYQAAEYSRVLELLQQIPAGQQPALELLRYGILSHLKLGKPEEAWKLYTKLVADNRPDEPAVLRDIARSFIVTRVRDTQEHIRIAAYTALAEMGESDTLPILEDGLLDSSALVRARAAEAIGRAGLAGRSSALKRALRDEAPGVRIAAINALSDAKVAGITDQLTEIARVDEGPESIFAFAGLYKLGRTDVLTDISNAVTLPDPEAAP